MNLARRRRDLQRRAAAAAAAARLFNQVGKLRAAHKWRRRPRREAKSAWGKVLAMVLNRDQRADSAPVVAFLPGRLARAASIFQKFARGEPSRAEPRRAKLGPRPAEGNPPPPPRPHSPAVPGQQLVERAAGLPRKRRRVVQGRAGKKAEKVASHSSTARDVEPRRSRDVITPPSHATHTNVARGRGGRETPK